MCPGDFLCLVFWQLRGRRTVSTHLQEGGCYQVPCRPLGAQEPWSSVPEPEGLSTVVHVLEDEVVVNAWRVVTWARKPLLALTGWGGVAQAGRVGKEQALGAWFSRVYPRVAASAGVTEW